MTGTGIAVFNRFGVFKNDAGHVFIQRIQNFGSVFIIPALITEVMGEMDYRQVFQFFAQLRRNQTRFLLGNRKIFGQSGKGAAVPVVGDQQVGCGQCGFVFLQQSFNQDVNRFGEKGEAFDFVDVKFV